MQSPCRGSGPQDIVEILVVRKCTISLTGPTGLLMFYPFINRTCTCHIHARKSELAGQDSVQVCDRVPENRHLYLHITSRWCIHTSRWLFTKLVTIITQLLVPSARYISLYSHPSGQITQVQWILAMLASQTLECIAAWQAYYSIHNRPRCMQ